MVNGPLKWFPIWISNAHGFLIRYFIVIIDIIHGFTTGKGFVEWITLPETNSSSLKIGHPKRKLVFHMLVSGRASDLLSGLFRLLGCLCPFLWEVAMNITGLFSGLKRMIDFYSCFPRANSCIFESMMNSELPQVGYGMLFGGYQGDI